jgi:hypothetical protein
MQEQLKKLKRNNLIIIQIKTMATIVNAYETDIEKGNIPMAVAVPVPSAPPSFDIAPDDEAEWPSVKVYGANFVPDLINLKKTIDVLELWDWMAQDKPPDDKGYMFWNHENISIISKKLGELYSNPHSGATWGYAMRVMQAIAQQGFDNWKDNYNSSK